MKSKRKGFTLIELLAVIVILAIIALIAVPIVLNLIEKSRKGSFTRSAESVLKASKIYYTSGLLEVETLEDIRFECSNNECISNKIGEAINLNVNGNIGEGYVVVTKEGEIEFKLQNGKYCAVKSKNNESVILKEENCDKIDITNDKTAPEIKNISTVTSTNSIEVTVGAEDIESGISGYSYSIDGINYTEIQENNVYKFEGRSKDNEPYTVYVRVYNGTYGKDGYTEETGMSEGKKEGIELKTLETPTIIVSPEGWQRSKTVKIDYPEGEYIEEYSIDEGEWKTYEGEFTIDKNVTIVAQISDGKNVLYSPAITVVNIDDKEPSIIITYTKEDENEYVIGNWSDQNVIVTVNAEDKNIDGSIGSGITKYEIIYDGQIVESNKVTINKEGKSTIKVKVTDGVDRVVETEEVEIKIDKNVPIINYSVPGGSYNENKTITVSAADTNFKNLSVHVWVGKVEDYEYFSANQSINETNSNSFDVTLSEGMWTIYSYVTDEAGNIQTQTPQSQHNWYYQEYTIDTTEPVVTIGVSDSTTNSITLPYTVIDNMSEITSKTCKYGTEYLKYTETGSINDKECVLSGLEKEKKYYYQICATDALGNEGCAEGNSESKTISAPEITPSNTPSTAVNGYLKSQTLNVTYSSANITSPTYYIMSERAGRSNVNVIESCGTGLEPGTCSTASTTTIVANTWYKVSGNISVTYDVTNATENQYLYGRTTDGKNISSTTYPISKIDATAPTITADAYVYSSATNSEGYTDTGVLISTYSSNEEGETIFDYTNTGINFRTSFIDDNSGIAKSTWYWDKSYTTIDPGKYFVENSSYGSADVYNLVSLSGEGYRRGRLVVEDNVGNQTVYHVAVPVDKTIPTVTYNVAGGTYNTTKTVTVTANDINYSHMYIHVYKNGTIAFVNDVYDSNSHTINLDSDGVWTIYTVAYDKAGNKQNQSPDNGGGWYYQEYVIDTTRPTVSYSVAGGIYNSNQTIRITGTDTNYSNMAVRVYKGNALDYSNFISSKSNDVINNGVFDVSLDSDGIYTIYTDIVDSAGNTENQNPNNGDWYYQEYYIDTQKPTISYNYNSISDQGGYGGAYYMGCFNGGITPILTLADVGISGISTSDVRVWKDGTWINNHVSLGNNQYQIPMDTEGRYIPHVYDLYDNAGNRSDYTRESDLGHLTVWDIDTSAPTMSISFNGYTPGNWTNGNISISLSGANTGCETTKNYYYSINDGSWVHFGTGDTATYNIVEDANYNIKFLVTDGWGRWGTQTGNYQILRDATAPNVTLGTATVTKDSITIPFTTTDNRTISGTSCVYGTNTNYGSVGTISGNNCLITGLASSTTYYYKITASDGLNSGYNTGSATTKTAVDCDAASKSCSSSCSSSCNSSCSSSCGPSDCGCNATCTESVNKSCANYPGDINNCINPSMTSCMNNCTSACDYGSCMTNCMSGDGGCMTSCVNDCMSTKGC